MTEDKRDKLKHPIQPLANDGTGVTRFKENRIVRFLLDEGPFDLNHIARKDFSQEDSEQFAQLIGYSHGGFAELGYVTDETWEAAQKQQGKNKSLQARYDVLAKVVKNLKKQLKKPIAELYGIHPDDLNEN